MLRGASPASSDEEDDDDNDLAEADGTIVEVPEWACCVSNLATWQIERASEQSYISASLISSCMVCATGRERGDGIFFKGGGGDIRKSYGLKKS